MGTADADGNFSGGRWLRHVTARRWTGQEKWLKDDRAWAASVPKGSWRIRRMYPDEPMTLWSRSVQGLAARGALELASSKGKKLRVLVILADRWDEEEIMLRLPAAETGDGTFVVDTLCDAGAVSVTRETMLALTRKLTRCVLKTICAKCRKSLVNEPAFIALVDRDEHEIHPRCHAGERLRGLNFNGSAGIGVEDEDGGFTPLNPDHAARARLAHEAYRLAVQEVDRGTKAARSTSLETYLAGHPWQRTFDECLARVQAEART